MVCSGVSRIKPPTAIPGVDGVRVYVLGPPENPKLLRNSDPSQRAPEVYSLTSGMDLGFAAALRPPGEIDDARPFDPSFEIRPAAAKRKKFHRDLYYADAWRQIEDDWLGSSERLALQLNSDTVITTASSFFPTIGLR